MSTSTRVEFPAQDGTILGGDFFPAEAKARPPK